MTRQSPAPEIIRLAKELAKQHAREDHAAAMGKGCRYEDCRVIRPVQLRPSKRKIH